MNRTLTADRIRGSLALTLTALIWGTAFVAQSVGAEHVGALTFNAARWLLGGTTLLPVIFLRRRRTPKQDKPALWRGGIACGAVLALGSALQQLGVAQTSVGRAGFLSVFYILFVPLLGLLLFRRRVTPLLWLSVLLALVGMYLLCMRERFALETGDALVLLSSVVFAIHILVVDHFAARCDGVMMSCIQFFAAAVFSALPALLFEAPTPAQIAPAWVTLVYAGVLSSGVGYTLQVVAQKWVEPTVASLLMSLESVFAALSGWVLLSQALSLREIFGCALVFTATLLAQWPQKAAPDR